MKLKKSKKTGPARMRELGRVAVTIYLTPEQVVELDATRGSYPRASWVKHLLGKSIRQLMQYGKAS